MTASGPQPRPTLAVVSADIRRDLVAPMRHFTRLRIVHLYRQAPYGDLGPGDMDESLVAYHSPLDLFQYLRRARPDMVQGVEPCAISQLPYQAAVYAYARLWRKPLVAGAHISRPLREKYGPLPARLLRLVLWPYMRYTRLFFYLNEGSRRNLLWMGAPEARLVRHMYGTWGVDTGEFTPARDGREPDWGPGPVLLFVGRLHAEKGIFDLLAAYGRAREAVPGLRLALIGDGPERAAAEGLVRERGWQGGVLFLGTIKHQALPPYFRAATAFVSPAVTTRRWEEYVGVTNLQAMASGVAVISTRSGAIPEYVPETAGMLVPERDPAALADTIVRVLADEAGRRAMGAAGRALAVERYDAVRNVQRAEEILLGLVPGRAV